MVNVHPCAQDDLWPLFTLTQVEDILFNKLWTSRKDAGSLQLREWVQAVSLRMVDREKGMSAKGQGQSNEDPERPDNGQYRNPRNRLTKHLDPGFSPGSIQLNPHDREHQQGDHIPAKDNIPVGCEAEFGDATDNCGEGIGVEQQG